MDNWRWWLDEYFGGPLFHVVRQAPEESMNAFAQAWTSLDVMGLSAAQAEVTPVESKSYS